jgi:putative RecB family exonuclease
VIVGPEISEDDTRPRRSVSQINQYMRCPMAYKLSRIDKAWGRPAAWLPQGSAVHTVCEHYELRRLAGNPMSLEEALDLFRTEYAMEVSDYTEETPNFDYWSWSGPYNGERDVERRYHVGLEQVTKFVEFSQSQVIWIAPDGTPGIELEFKIDLDGILVRGFIDAIVQGPEGPRVRDYKTGNTPGDDFQLAVYALAVSEVYGIDKPQQGDYYMAGKKGKKAGPTAPYDLSHWTKEEVSAVFAAVEAKIQAGEFEPDPEPNKCKFCDVNRACPTYNGQ